MNDTSSTPATSGLLELDREQDEPAVGRPAAWAATAVVCLAVFLIGLDFTVLNVAIPALRRDLGPSMAQTQWIVDGYALTLGGCVMAAGTISDSHGRRRAFVAGLVVCALASVFGALADSAAQVVVARGAMGLGAALFMPATLATITHVFAAAEADRQRAMSLWAAVAGIGALTGPVAGGWLVQEHSWRVAFWLNVPVALVAAVLALLVVPESRGARPGRLDRWGAALCCAGLLALVWGVIEAPGRGWLSGAVLTSFVAAGALLGLFVWWESRAPAPMLPVAVLRDARVCGAALALVLMAFTVFGAMFVLTLYLQQVRGLSAWAAGARITPLSAGLAVGAAAAVLVSRRYGPRVSIAGGLGLIAAGSGVLAGVESGSGDVPVVVFGVLSGLGGGLVAPVATELIMSALPRSESGTGSALNDASRQLGSTLGVAVLGSVLATVASDRAGRGADVLGAAGAVEVGAEAVRQARQAFVDGMTTAAWVGGVTALVGVPLVWRWLAGRGPALPVDGDQGCR